MLDVVMSAADHKVGLAPDDLAADFKPTGFETLSHNDRLHTRMPHVRYRSSKQVPRFAPVGAIVVANGSDRTVCFPEGGIAPIRLILDAVRRIGHHENRLVFSEEMSHIGRVSGITASQPVRAQN